MTLEERDYQTYFHHYFPKLRPRANGVASVPCPFHKDRNPSLSINVKEGIWYCFAGCGGGGVIAFEQLQNGGGRKEAWEHVAQIIGKSADGGPPESATTYDYTDETGKLLYQVVRLPGKKFRQRLPDGDGGWVWNLTGVRRVPYRLPEVLKVECVFIVEGEKDVETLRGLGLVATTNSGGAGKWRDEFAAFFKGKDVVILPDNDEPGRKHVEQVAANLAPVARSLKVVLLPGLSEKGDVSNFCAKVGEDAKKLLLAYVEDAPAWAPATKPSGAEVGADERSPEHLTDSGNARRIVTMHGQDMRYCAAAGGWLIWNGKCWEPDKSSEAVRRVKAALKDIYREAESIGNKTEREQHLRWAKQSEAQGKIQAALALAQSERELVIMPDELDKDPWLLNCLNGTLDLRTGKLIPHRREDFITKLAGADYDPHAEYKLWSEFLERVLDVNPDLKAYLQSAAGYSLTGSTREQCLFMLYGTGNNGKTTFLETAREVWGTYAQNADFCTFALRERSGASGDLARLAGARLVTSVEPEKGERLSLSRIKQVTGGDRVTARHLFQSEFEFNPQMKLWFAVNDKPRVGSVGPAMWRRIKAIPFTVTIPEAEIKKDLPEKLRAEHAGILRWAVEGCLGWREPGFKTPQVILEATEEYRQESDTLAEFIGECCEKDPKALTSTGDLYMRYAQWCEKSRERLCAKNTFASLLEERGYHAVREGKLRTRVRQGIKLKSEQEAFPEHES